MNDVIQLGSFWSAVFVVVAIRGTAALLMDVMRLFGRDE